MALSLKDFISFQLRGNFAPSKSARTAPRGVSKEASKRALPNYNNMSSVKSTDTAKIQV